MGVTIALLLVALLSLDAAPARAETPRADLSRLVVVGDSLSAGYQNGSLLAEQQARGYASLVARQAGVDLPLPLVAAPGVPNVLTLVHPGPPPVVAPAPGVSIGRLDPWTQPMSLAVPGHRVRDALETRSDCDFGNEALLLTNLVLGLPSPCLGFGPARSQVEWAEALAPTTILVWLGANDSLGAVLAGDASYLTPAADFAASYREILDRLAATGATLVVANVADATAVPYLTSAEEVAALVGQPLAVVGPLLGLARGDYVTPEALPRVQAILAGLEAGPLPAGVVLDAGEVAEVQSATAAYNAIIEAEAAARGAGLVDVHGLLDRAARHGYVVGGRRLTTRFLGGLFGLDGLHPTDTAQAIIANAFIETLNRRFAAGIPPVVVRLVQREDRLVLPDAGRPAGPPAAPIPPSGP